MNRFDFIRDSVLSLPSDLFNSLKSILISLDCLVFRFGKPDNISQESFCEKLYDYFEKTEIKTNRSFDKIIEKFTNDLDSIVNDKIAKDVKANNNQPAVKPRARKYYERACAFKKWENNLIDYTRIMLCLYTAIIKNKHQTVDNFDLSAECLDLTQIIDAMQKEKAPVTIGPIIAGTRPRFDVSKPYEGDRCTFVLLIVIYHWIKSKEMAGEY